MKARLRTVIVISLLLPSALRAQIAGVVADAVVAQRSVPGAVITVLDSARRVVTRGIADEAGRFRIAGTAAARRLRVVKIGYRAVEIPVTPTSSGLRIALERLPNMLEPVLSEGQPRCPRNATRPAAFGLWEQARAALLGTVLARETNVAQVRRLNFRRYMTAKGDEIARQSVRRDSGLALRSFDAVHPAAEFMTRGFAEPEADRKLRFYGPDAEVLLNDALPDHYCLELAPARRERPNQAGLRFRPMSRRPGRVDLDGTVWIDTAARVLKDIEYEYLGLEEWADDWHPGGVIAFNEVAPASVWIDRWWIRMTGAGVEQRQRSEIPPLPRQAFVVEGGAELSSALWPDGRRWDASLGTAEIRITSRAGQALSEARVRLDSTDYEGTTDAAGRVVISELLPGPYTISVRDSTLAVVDTALPATPRFFAARDSISTVTATVPSLAEFVTQGCKDKEWFELRSYMLVARVVGADSQTALAKWRLDYQRGEAPLLNQLTPRSNTVAEGVTTADGMLFVCKHLGAGQRMVLRVWPATASRDKDVPAAEAPFTVTRPVSAIKVVLPP